MKWTYSRDKTTNAEQRKALALAAKKSACVRRAVREYCAKDMLWWSGCYGWVFEPRIPAKLPFIPFEFQEKHLLEIEGALHAASQAALRGDWSESIDVGWEKSRGVGATWLICFFIAHCLCFREDYAMGIASRNEKAVDDLNDPDSVMWKLRFILKNLPPWMHDIEIGVDDPKLKIINRVSGASVMGYSAVKDLGRGGRKTFWFMDEFASFAAERERADSDALASTQFTTLLRIILSTPKGTGNEFYKVMRDQGRSVLRLRSHWSEHPDWRRGLYTAVDGRLRILDESYEFAPDYPFILDGKTRSPYYDAECRRAPSEAFIAQELDIDYLGSGVPFFSIPTLESLIRKARPGQACSLTEDGRKTRFVAGSGKWNIWFDLRMGAPHGQYVLGIDIAVGAGGDKDSNSCICVFNRTTGQKVAEFCAHDVDVKTLAREAILAARFFHDGYLIWDSQGGLGKAFKMEVVQANYPNLYSREDEEADTGKKSRKLGFPTGTHKYSLLTAYSSALNTGEFDNPSARALEECKQFVHAGNQKVEHVAAMASPNPASQGENHGDAVIADSLAWRGAMDYGAVRIRDKGVTLLPGEKPDLSTPRGRYLQSLMDDEASVKPWRRRRDLDSRPLRMIPAKMG